MKKNKYTTSKRLSVLLTVITVLGLVALASGCGKKKDSTDLEAIFTGTGGTGTNGTGTGTSGTGTGTGGTGTGTEKPPKLYCAEGQYGSGYVSTNAGARLYDGEIVHGTSKYGFVKIDLSNVDPTARAASCRLHYYITKPGPAAHGIHKSDADPQAGDKYLESGATLLSKLNPPKISTWTSWTISLSAINDAVASGQGYKTFLFKPC
ncbi:MAG: hypothetical protein ACYS8W_04450 [Planctomycetota bacterium]